MISQRCVMVIADVKTKTPSICSFNIQQSVVDTPDRRRTPVSKSTLCMLLILFISLVVTLDLITLIHDTHTITGRESVSMATLFQRCLSREGFRNLHTSFPAERETSTIHNNDGKCTLQMCSRRWFVKHHLNQYSTPPYNLNRLSLKMSSD